MPQITVTPNMVIPLGRLGENDHTKVIFDVSEWQSEYPGCHFTLLNKRPGENDRLSHPLVSSPAE